jgi:putative nucleotidyltransferase with HDIG domain
MISEAVRELRHRPPLPQASAESLDEHARAIAHLQNILGLVATLPGAKRPPVAQWDDVLGPLWRLLFAKGADIDRYSLARQWRPVLQEAGETDRHLRTTTAMAASARNFFHFEEALEYCREGRAAARLRPSAALANLVNTEGIIHTCVGDFDAAEASFQDAETLAASLPEEELLRWAGVGRSDFLGQERLNRIDVLLRRGFTSEGREKAAAVAAAGSALAEMERDPLDVGLRQLYLQDLAELAILRERFVEARDLLTRLYFDPQSSGPYRFSLQASQSRLMSVAFSREGDWNGAYHWIRKAVRESVGQCYPAEEQFVLEQALVVLRGLHGSSPSTREDLIRDLVRLLEEKDWYTGRSHARGVSRLAALLAERLCNGAGWRLPMDVLKEAGLLHDIGKLRIPWSLLNKIAPLTPTEMNLLREHARHGGVLLREIGMTDVADVVEQHHEAMDGSGYPAGRPPSDMAAVIAVCDAFEASVTPNRKYKEPKTKVTAVAELVSGAGRIYHRDVVEALIQVVQADSR